MGSSYRLFVSNVVAGFFAARVKTLGFCCLAILALPCCFAQQPAPGSIAGEVFNIGPDGQRGVVPGAHINLSGPVRAPDRVGCCRPIPL